ncbi:MAG TPA: NAD(P)-dependent alcohol dehydrogenase [Bryobacteraceae bacterium]|nr:NAD(P)-dependent alcohol dehydrogenase [Bryobacteraceae bacterium]
MTSVRAYSATDSKAALAPANIERRDVTPHDVQLEILFCGVCHSDLHQARNEWADFMPTSYPCVPGHEIVGRVTAVGNAVTRFAAGDIVGVGCMVDSCGECGSCKEGDEVYCSKGTTFTYNSPDNHSGGHTLGGYSKSIVVNEHFALKVPANLDLAGVAPLLCAGITSYSPLHQWKVGPGQKVGIVGLGGLGHMGVKFAKALGAEVVLFTTSASKVEDGLRLGASQVVISKDPAQMAQHTGSFDFILDTVSADHDINSLIALLKRKGTLCLVGVPEKPLAVSSMGLIFGSKRLSGSVIGGTLETQEMLDFCGKHNITSDVEIVPIQQINEAFTRMARSDVKYRFVIDMATLS